MVQASDIRAVPQRVLDLYLYPIGAWGVSLAFLFVAGRTQLAFFLLYALACWQLGLTLWWRRDLLRRLAAGGLTEPEARAGVRSVGQILATSALTPAIVFLATDPLSPGALGTSIGNAILAGVAWAAVSASSRVARPSAHALALFVACVALPVNATGAVTVATLTGWFAEVVTGVGLDAPGDPPDAEPRGDRDR